MLDPKVGIKESIAKHWPNDPYHQHKAVDNPNHLILAKIEGIEGRANAFIKKGKPKVKGDNK